MTFKNFNKDGNNYISKDRFFFENNKVKFSYRYLVRIHVDQPHWDGVDYATYSILLLVDDESIHEKWRNDSTKDIICSYLLREKTYKGNVNEVDFNKSIKGIESLKIENKIKIDKYQQIIGITTGCKFYV